MVWDSQILVPRRRGPPGSTSLVPREEDGVSCPRAVFDPDEPLPRIVADSRRRPDSRGPASPSRWFGPRPHGPPAVASGREPAQRRALRSQTLDCQAAGFGGSWLRVVYLTDDESYPAARRTGAGDGLCPSDALEEMP
jgi:hypothetical protein